MSIEFVDLTKRPTLEDGLREMLERMRLRVEREPGISPELKAAVHKTINEELEKLPQNQGAYTPYKVLRRKS